MSLHVFAPGQRIESAKVNANFAELAANSMRQFGQNDALTDGLTWAFFGGITRVAAGPVTVPDGTVDLVANAANRVELDPATGVVATQTTANWNAAKIPLRLIVTTDFAIVESHDMRAGLVAPGSGNGGGVAAAGASEVITVNAPARDSGAAALVSFPLGAGVHVGRVQTNVAAWVRIYPTIADRDADAVRGLNDDPSADVTVAFEAATEAGRLILNVAPAAALFDPENDGWPGRVVNLSGANAAIAVALTTRVF